ncbi:hypothetical protein [Brevundimonas sp.]|jgi:hypothetical protein|uniref:hypothetical protein n=1 Tax=Brevundimonas sp. TaxID=1871086 RepID=UPI002E1413B2|nr:hypothetical protein [Brevundimonas sp.]
MLRPIDVYTTTAEFTIAGKGGATLGTLFTRYEVRRINDLRNLSESASYRLTSTARVVIGGAQTEPTWPNYQFNDYPALVACGSILPVSGDSVRLVDYAPRTLNATVSAASSSNDGSTASSTIQRSSGSAVTQTNSYGASVSVGLMGPSVTADYNHSEAQETNQSRSRSTDRGSTHDSGENDSLSIKDWAGYASLNGGIKAPQWTWAQEYPWDILQYNVPLPDSDGLIPMPTMMLDRMFVAYDYFDLGYTVGPPSCLSLFGIDFVMKACWEFDLPASAADQLVTLKHPLTYWSASHGLSIAGGGHPTPYSKLDKTTPGATYTSPALDLTLLGLDPILSGDGDNGAVVGFIKSKFLAPPGTTTAFKILSDANNLQVEGSGFDATMTTAGGKTTSSLTVHFKILDATTDYALFLKAWVAKAGSCLLSFTFNGDPDSTVTRRVDALEGQGGENNLISVVMRNKDYTSNDFHDYLKLGANRIDIQIAADGSGAAAPFALKALAIGEG